MKLYRVADVPFNQRWYSSIIGRTYHTPPPYAFVDVLEVETCGICGTPVESSDPHPDFCPNHQEQIEEAQAAYERGHIAA
jgi:hypothetical protein